MDPLPPRNSIRLREVVSPASFVGCGDLVIRSVSSDSRSCQGIDLFACLSGTRVDGHSFAGQAIENGARALLVERPIPELPVPQCVVPNTRQAFALLCHALTCDAACKMRTVGVTGTNGKTTATWMLRHILEFAGQRTGLLGTVECTNGTKAVPAKLTTPDPADLAAWYYEMYSNDCKNAVLEVSSHALQQDRIAGVPMSAAIVTNVTQDHLDYHGTLDAYIEAKALISNYLLPDCPLIWNGDCENTRRLVEKYSTSTKAISFGERGPSDVRIVMTRTSADSMEFQLIGLGGIQRAVEFTLPAIGHHNAENATAAAIAAVELGIMPEIVVNALSQFSGVPGRLEKIPTTLPIRCFVDYAHTPDALDHVLQSLKQTCTGRLICVFGAGGDRDVTKRPLLGRAAMTADLAIVTSDNPRTEAPSKIIQQIVSHPKINADKIEVQIDRRAAIRWAVENAHAEDCIVICGKGHETTQTIGTKVLPFDDRQELRAALRDKEIQDSLHSIQASA